jgi:hypothetical protein
MKAPIHNATGPSSNLETSGFASDLYLEIEAQDTSLRLPVQVKNLADAGVILEVLDLPPGLQGETLLHQVGTLHMVPDGFTKETRLRSQVVWVRQGNGGPSHYLLGLDLAEADFRGRRFLENLIARPKDMSDLWTYWDQVQTKPGHPGHDGRIIFFVGAGVSLGGLALKVALPDSYGAVAVILTLLGVYVIAGKCLWNWWRGRSIPKEN